MSEYNVFGKLCVQEKTLQYFTIDGTEYQCPQSESMCQVLVIPFEEQTNSFFFEVWSNDVCF